MKKSSLPELTLEQLELAQNAPSGRSSLTLHGEHELLLRQTLVALTAGSSLDEGQSLAGTTVQVLQGNIRVSAGQESWEGQTGDFLVVPAGHRHRLKALDASVLLISVATHIPARITLTSEEVEQVRLRVERGESKISLAEMFNVTLEALERVLVRRW